MKPCKVLLAIYIMHVLVCCVLKMTLRSIHVPFNFFLRNHALTTRFSDTTTGILSLLASFTSMHRVESFTNHYD
jgi:hypothetical protein